MSHYRTRLFKYLIYVLPVWSLLSLLTLKAFAEPLFEKHYIDPTIFIPELFPSQSETIATWQPDITTELPNAQNTKYIKIKSSGVIFKLNSDLYVLTTSHSVSGKNTKVRIENNELSLEDKDMSLVVNNIVEDYAILKLEIPLKITTYFTYQKINNKDEIIFQDPDHRSFFHYQMSLNKFTPLKEFHKRLTTQAKSKISIEDQNIKILKDGYFSKSLNRFIFNMPILAGQSGSPVLEYNSSEYSSVPSYKVIGIITSFHRVHPISYVLPITTIIQSLKTNTFDNSIYNLKWIYENGPTRLSPHYSESTIVGLAGGGATGEGGGGATGEGGGGATGEGGDIVTFQNNVTKNLNTERHDKEEKTFNLIYRKIYESRCHNQNVSFYKKESHFNLLTWNSLHNLCKQNAKNESSIYNKDSIKPLDLLNSSPPKEINFSDSGVCQIKKSSNGIYIFAEYDHNLIHPQKRIKFQWPESKANSTLSIEIFLSLDELLKFKNLNLIYPSNDKTGFIDISEIFFENPYLPTLKTGLASLYISSENGFRQIVCEVKNEQH